LLGHIALNRFRKFVAGIAMRRHFTGRCRKLAGLLMKLSLSRELLIGCIVIVVSVAVLPGLIYVVGGKLFGAYGTTGGMSSMYQAMLTDLATPTLAAWTIALCPALCILLLRLLFAMSQSPSAETTDRPTRVRREPSI
jgi:uncharacterized membrane protein